MSLWVAVLLFRIAYLFVLLLSCIARCRVVFVGCLSGRLLFVSPCGPAVIGLLFVSSYTD